MCLLAVVTTVAYLMLWISFKFAVGMINANTGMYGTDAKDDARLVLKGLNKLEKLRMRSVAFWVFALIIFTVVSMVRGPAMGIFTTPLCWGHILAYLSMRKKMKAYAIPYQTELDERCDQSLNTESC